MGYQIYPEVDQPIDDVSSMGEPFDELRDDEA